jgi:hypothetical protein
MLFNLQGVDCLGVCTNSWREYQHSSPPPHQQEVQQLVFQAPLWLLDIPPHPLLPLLLLLSSNSISSYCTSTTTSNCCSSKPYYSSTSSISHHYN